MSYKLNRVIFDDSEAVVEAQARVLTNNWASYAWRYANALAQLRDLKRLVSPLVINQPVYLTSFIPKRKNRRWLQHVSACVFSAAVARMVVANHTQGDGPRSNIVSCESGGRAPGRCAFQNNVIQCRLRHWGSLEVWDDAPGDGEPSHGSSSEPAQVGQCRRSLSLGEPGRTGPTAP